jgi:predicted secreted protein|tara:strand:+ start:179 stop:580 length:402 start_codon:yes stop_codon:yes gene_type:complete
MASSAIAGVGAVFKRNSVTVGEVNSISGPNKARDTIDVTTLDSTGGYREFIGGFRDGGEVSLDMNWTRSGFDDLNDDFESNAGQSFSIIMPDTGNTDFSFTGFVTNISKSIPADDKITMSVTIKIDGQITESS